MSFIKKIFKSFQSQKPADSFAWVSDLNGMDDISAIEYATQQLNIDFKNNIFQDDQYLDAFCSIEEKTHIIVERVSTHYIYIDNISLSLEERMSNAVFLYHRQVFLIYQSLVESLASFQPDSLLILLARAINSATGMIKWRYYNYQSAPANAWLQISLLYKVAENNALLDTAVHLYQNVDGLDSECTTISAAYIQVCMLGSLESLSFKCQQIELVCKILSEWTSKILIHKNYDEKKHLFYVDTAHDSAAKRIRNFKPAESYRYWCFDSINSNMELCISLIELNLPIKQQSWHEIISNKYALKTMRVLYAEWSRDEYKRQRRVDVRVKTAKLATIAYGLENVCYQIKRHEQTQLHLGLRNYQGVKTFDERLASHHVDKVFAESAVTFMDFDNNQSKIVDQSIRGLGLRVTKHINEVDLGMMVCIFDDVGKNTSRIGVIRSVKPNVGNELHLGVQLLSTSATYVDMSSASLKSRRISSTNNSSFDGFNLQNLTPSSSFSCIYLPIELGISKKESLVLSKHDYNNHDVFNVNVLGKDIAIKLTKILAQDEDWLRVAFSEELLA